MYLLAIKGVSIRLLHVIAHRKNLQVLCRDVGTAFLKAKTNKKAYFIVVLEFGDKEGIPLTIVKALDGLCNFAE